MKVIPIIARLTSTDIDDSRAAYVYLELTRADVATLHHVERLCSAAKKVAWVANLRPLSRVAIDGPGMVPLAELPPLTEKQQRTLELEDCAILSGPIRPEELEHGEVRLCCEELHLYASGGLYAVACDKHSRIIFEADLGAIKGHLRQLLKEETLE